MTISWQNVLVSYSIYVVMGLLSNPIDAYPGKNFYLKATFDLVLACFNRDSNFYLENDVTKNQTFRFYGFTSMYLGRMGYFNTPLSLVCFTDRHHHGQPNSREGSFSQIYSYHEMETHGEFQRLQS